MFAFMAWIPSIEIVTLGGTKCYNPKKGIFLQYQSCLFALFLRNFKVTPMPNVDETNQRQIR